MNVLLANRQLRVSLIILIASVAVFYGLMQLKGAPEKEPERETIPLVESQRLFTESVTLTVRSQGVVRPASETQLVAEVSGVVTDVSPLFASGAVFSEGDILASIDPSDYKVALIQAEAALASSKARLAEEIAKSEAEKKNWQRSGKKLVNAPDLLLRKPFVAEARANVKAAKAQVVKAQRDLEKTTIKAPYAGMVIERSLNKGQFVATGAALGTVFSTDVAEVRLPLKPSDLEFIDIPGFGQTKSTTTVVQLEQRQGRVTLQRQGVIARAEGVVDEHSRMHYLVAEIRDPYGLAAKGQPVLKAGSFVYAKLQGKTLDNLYRIPRSALYGSGKVLVYQGNDGQNGNLWFRNVDIVYASEDAVFVTGDLMDGDRLCITAINNPVDGMKARILSATTADADHTHDNNLLKL